MRKVTFWLVGLLALALVGLVAAAPATAAPENILPDVIPLPDGFQPEGIVRGRGAVLYTGSLANGAIYAADPLTGAGEIVVPPQEGQVAVGLGFDNRTEYIYAAGGPGGNASVYDSNSGDLVARYQFSSGPAFINDVVVTRNAAYFTDSFAPVLYKLPLGPFGLLPDESAVETIPLGGEFVFDPSGPFPINSNGIAATFDAQYLIVVNTATQTLYRVDPDTGNAVAIDLGGAAVPNGDGLLLRNFTLYVVQNFLNQIAVIQMNEDFTSGRIVNTITDEDFRIPTTVTALGPYLYAVNARFDVQTPTADTEYEIVRVPSR